MYSFSGNCTASVPISTFMCLRAIYIFPGSLRDICMWKLGLGTAWPHNSFSGNICFKFLVLFLCSEGLLLLTVETEANGTSRSTIEWEPSLADSLGSSCRNKRFLPSPGCFSWSKIFFSSPYTITVHLSHKVHMYIPKVPKCQVPSSELGRSRVRFIREHRIQRKIYSNLQIHHEISRGTKLIWIIISELKRSWNEMLKQFWRWKINYGRNLPSWKSR